MAIPQFHVGSTICRLSDHESFKFSINLRETPLKSRIFRVDGRAIVKMHFSYKHGCRLYTVYKLLYLQLFCCIQAGCKEVLSKSTFRRITKKQLDCWQWKSLIAAAFSACGIVKVMRMSLSCSVCRLHWIGWWNTSPSSFQTTGFWSCTSRDWAFEFRCWAKIPNRQFKWDSVFPVIPSVCW